MKRSFMPDLQKAYFWSDGCTGQFRSRFTFGHYAYTH